MRGWWIGCEPVAADRCCGIIAGVSDGPHYALRVLAQDAAGRVGAVFFFFFFFFLPRGRVGMAAVPTNSAVRIGGFAAGRGKWDVAWRGEPPTHVADSRTGIRGVLARHRVAAWMWVPSLAVSSPTHRAVTAAGDALHRRWAKPSSRRPESLPRFLWVATGLSTMEAGPQQIAQMLAELVSCSKLNALHRLPVRINRPCAGVPGCQPARRRRQSVVLDRGRVGRRHQHVCWHWDGSWWHSGRRQWC